MNDVPASEIERIEREHRGGISARQVVRFFEERGVRLSQGTFRKYVQVGLLPRSRRVGRKGKNRGSSGLYPPGVVRRIGAIKSMMAGGMTLEEIRDSFLVVRGDIDAIEQHLGGVVERLIRAVSVRAIPVAEKSRLSAELDRLRDDATKLTGKLERIGSRIAAARSGSTGQPGSAPEGT